VDSDIKKEDSQHSMLDVY